LQKYEIKKNNPEETKEKQVIEMIKTIKNRLKFLNLKDTSFGEIDSLCSYFMFIRSISTH
jgi:hypothetical protein